MCSIQLAALWLTGPAFATDYDAELGIPSEHPAWMKEDYAPTYRRFLRKLTEQENPGDTVVDSTDSRVKCRVKSSWMIVEFSADRDNWPAASALPLTATCTYGSDTLEITVLPYEPEVDPAFQEMEIQATQSSQEVNITRITGGRVLRSYKLPNNCSGNFETGQYASTIEGVACRVFYRSTQPMVQVDILPDATIGTITCTLPLDDDNDYVLTINLDEHDP